MNDPRRVCKPKLRSALPGAMGADEPNVGRGGLDPSPGSALTSVLIALGSALFTAVSTTRAGGNGSDRIAAQVVTAVGFLGGGAILRSGRTVH